jgi:antagonist of KipI
MIEVLHPGITTIQDSGRKSFEQFGMPRSGAFDPFLARIANKLVGNDVDAPLLEFALVGPSLIFHKSCSIAIAAHECRYSVNEKAVPEFQSFTVPSGATFRFEGMNGWFGYLAFSGSIQCEKILNSASAYVSGGIGKRLAQREQLNSGSETERKYSVSKEALGLNKGNTLHILEATHTRLFADDAGKIITKGEYSITPQSDRMGIRLQGTTIPVPEIRRSTPTLPGVIQISRSGQPIILGPEGPVTGGYPQIGILSEASWTTLAGLKPGKAVRFEWIQLEAARKITETRNAILHDQNLWRKQ